MRRTAAWSAAEMMGTLTLAPPVLELQLMTPPPPPPPQRNTDEDLRRTAAPHPHSPNFWEEFLPAGGYSETIFRLHLMNFNKDVPGADISRSKYELYQRFQLDAGAQTATFCTQDCFKMTF